MTELEQLKKDNELLRKALLKAQEDINWMLNEQKFLNGFVFDYIDAVLDETYRGE